MYLVEFGKINVDIEIEFIILPNNYENEVKAFPLISRYKDFCQIKLKFLSGNEVMLILSAVSQFAQIAHSAGHSIHNMCYDICFNISFENMTDDIKPKLQKMTLDDVQIFFGISNEDIAVEGQKAFLNMISDIGKSFNN